MAYNHSNAQSSSYVGNESNNDANWSPDLDPEDLLELQAAQNDPSKIVAELPKESARMGTFSAVCLVVNRMIGKLSLYLLLGSELMVQ